MSGAGRYFPVVLEEDRAFGAIPIDRVEIFHDDRGAGSFSFDLFRGNAGDRVVIPQRVLFEILAEYHGGYLGRSRR